MKQTFAVSVFLGLASVAGEGNKYEGIKQVCPDTNEEPSCRTYDYGENLIQIDGKIRCSNDGEYPKCQNGSADLVDVVEKPVCYDKDNKETPVKCGPLNEMGDMEFKFYGASKSYRCDDMKKGGTDLGVEAELCPDGLAYDVKRDPLPECYGEDGKYEKVTCGKFTRDQVRADDGSWKCKADDGDPQEKCGDGLAPGAARTPLPVVCSDNNKVPECSDENNMFDSVDQLVGAPYCKISGKPPVCKDQNAPSVKVPKPTCLAKDGETFEKPSCVGYSGPEKFQFPPEINGRTWACPKGTEFEVCGDKLNPGASRTEVPAVCFEADNKTPEKIQCISGEPPQDTKYDQTKNAETGIWECKKQPDGPGSEVPCGDGLLPGIDREVLNTEKYGTCKNAAGDADEVPTCGEGKEEITRDPTNGKWDCGTDLPSVCTFPFITGDVTYTKCTNLSYGDKFWCSHSAVYQTGLIGETWDECQSKENSCGDGLNPGVDRKALTEEKHDTCKNEAGDAEEVPTCGKDKVEITRDPKNGKWIKCGDDAPVNPCGDGLNPGVDRKAFTEEKHDTCKNEAGDAEEVPTCGKDKVEITRDPTNGKWIKCGDDAPVNPCGDGLNPGVSRDKKPVVCLAKDEKTDEAIVCSDDSKQTRNAESGEWECLDEEAPKLCGDGYAPGDPEGRLMAGVCSDASETLNCEDGDVICKDKKEPVDDTGYCADDSNPPLWCEDKFKDIVKARCNNGKQPGGHQAFDKEEKRKEEEERQKYAEARKEQNEKFASRVALTSTFEETKKPVDEASYKTDHEEWKEAKKAYESTTKELAALHETTVEENEAVAAEIDKKFPGGDVSKANSSAVKLQNEERESRGALPVALNLEIVELAQAYLETFKCTTEKIGETDKSSTKCTDPEEERRRLEESGCGSFCDCAIHTWNNPDYDAGTATTSDGAVYAWEDNAQYFDWATGKATSADKKTEAQEFISMVNTDTFEVGFAIRSTVVLGVFCPPSSDDSEILKKTVPKVRAPPLAPKAPEGSKNLEDAPCPVISGGTNEDDPEVRESCAETLCCGESKSGDKSFSSCRDSSKTEFVDDGETFAFKCYLEDARRVVMSLSAIAVAVAFYV